MQSISLYHQSLSIDAEVPNVPLYLPMEILRKPAIFISSETPRSRISCRVNYKEVIQPIHRRPNEFHQTGGKKIALNVTGLETCSSRLKFRRPHPVFSRCTCEISPRFLRPLKHSPPLCARIFYLYVHILFFLFFDRPSVLAAPVT